MPGRSEGERSNEWFRHGKWLQERVMKAGGDGRLHDEPTSDLSAYVDALFTDEDFDKFNEPGRAVVIARLARAHRIWEWNEAGRPLTGTGPREPARKRRGPRKMPYREDVFGLDVTERDVWLWPFSAFFAQASTALTNGESLSEQSWPARVEELRYVLLLAHPGDEGQKILFELAKRAKIPRAKHIGSAESEEARAAVVEAWIRRQRVVDAYMPQARTHQEAAVRACRYVVTAMQNQGLREVARLRFTQSPQTISRYQNEGHQILFQDDADRVGAAKQARMKHKLTGTYSEQEIAKRLGCSRAVVSRAREKAVAAGQMREVPLVDGARRYRACDVLVVGRIVRRRTRRKQPPKGPGTP